jgi:flagellar hook-length control protein FliK
MGVFSNIVSAIFGTAKAASGTALPRTAPTAAAPAATASTAPGAGGAAKPQPMTRAQIEAMIQQVADTSGRKDYNWKQSIVDLMKLLNIDSSLTARKTLAQELGYTGALDGSAEMNVWLHKQVMIKLMESGGVVPDSLK